MMKGALISRSVPAVLVAIPIILGASSVEATKPWSHPSHVTLSVAENWTPTTPLVFSITASTPLNASGASLIFEVSSLEDHTIDTTTLWSGSTHADTPIEIAHAVGELSVGRYTVTIRFRFPRSSRNLGGSSSDHRYLEVKDDGWFLSRANFRTQDRQAFLAELRTQGLDTCSSPELRLTAPELERRLSAFGIWRTPKTAHPAKDAHNAHRILPKAGDLNLNGMPFEIADAALFIRFLLGDRSALSHRPHIRHSQIAAFDVDGDGDSMTTCDFDTLMETAGPLLTIEIGDNGASPGETVVLPITLTYHDLSIGGAIDFGGLNLNIRYDPTVLRFLRVELGAAFSEWEYLTYRNPKTYDWKDHASNNRVRIFGMRDMNDGKSQPRPDSYQDGTILNMTFLILPTVQGSPCETELTFYAEDCWSNILTSIRGKRMFDFVLSASDVIQAPDYDIAPCPEDMLKLRMVALKGGTVRIDQ